ncbi:MAG: peptidase T [Acidobacteria bacterium RIFCSPLOWO2_12_FULL_65_11]|nr:MAG: peptidase T [Acidobacteria bacterium RIFCSPLOWO2_02_FULL_64_15]OFW31355.1 MAG: peptidase T [Acidobacteria bacterium RIFCSPLOWO2_12_FULL_65_11]
MAGLEESVLARFLRYVTYDTQSDEASETYPSTATQLVLLRDLAAELASAGLEDAAIDEHGYVTATIPATSVKTGVPTIGLIAHVDTSPEMSGANVKPIVHRRYDGRDLVLPDDPAVVLRVTDCPPLASCIGDDIVTASGTTLLGADNKAGVAEIVTAAAYLVAHPDIPHGPIRILFTPDEEIGRGTKHFEVGRFGAQYAYTMDGGGRGEVESESFSADAMTVTFHGFNTHPGYAKGRMVNAIKIAADFVHLLPRDTLSPESTESYEGFVHPYIVRAGVDQTAVKLIVRDFDTARLHDKEALIERLAREAAAAYPAARIEIAVEEQYRNMREVLDRHPQVVEYAREAVRRAGVEVCERPIRGGTDGSRLSFMNLPTPNLFAGEHNFHSRLEWISVQDMEKAVQVIVHLCRVWEERCA